MTLLRYANFAFETGHANAGGFYSIIYMGVYDPILDNIVKSDVVVDGGANVGVFSILAAQKAKLVYAVEPHPVNFAYLCRNLTRNRVGNVVPLNLALGPENGLAKLEGEGEGAHLSRIGRSVYVTSIDNISREPVTVAKLDVEGAEVSTLVGKRSLDSMRLIVAEVDPVSLSRMNADSVFNPSTWSYQDLYLELQKRGFRVVMHNEIHGNVSRRRFDRHVAANELKTSFLGTRFFLKSLLTQGTNLLRPSSWKNDRTFYWMVYAFRPTTAQLHRPATPSD